MRRFYHIMADNHKDYIPHNILFLDSETKKYPGKDGITIHRAYMIYTCFCTLSDKESVTYTRKWEFWTDRKKFNDYINGLVRKKTTLYIMGSNLLFDLAACEFFKYFPEYGWQYRFDFSGGLVFILTLRDKTRHIKCLSMQNFFPVSIDELGESMGLEKLKVDYDNDPFDKIKAYCRRDTEILVDGVMTWIQFVKGHDLGNFKITRASQALTSFRHRFMKHKIYIHDNPLATGIERAAYYGGRCECFKIGDLKGERVRALDVNSMYSYVMYNFEYPVKFINFLREPSQSYIESALKDYAVVAECVLDTDQGDYALKFGGRTVFPTGRFTTYLCSAGLKHALDRGRVVTVNKACIYKKKRIFRDYVDYFYGLKKQYKADGKKLWQIITKCFLNYLYGKFGQYPRKIIKNVPDPENRLERQYITDLDGGQDMIVQYMFGRCIVYQGKAPTNDTFLAIPAHVTEYARLYLLSLIVQAGRENVYYCDTDSLFVNNTGYENLKPNIDKYGLGKLDVEKDMTDLIIYNLKDYEYSGIKKCKGIKKDAKEIKHNVFLQEHWCTLNGLMQLKCKEGFVVRKVTKELKRNYLKGTVDRSGNVKPFVFKDGVCSV